MSLLVCVVSGFVCAAVALEPRRPMTKAVRVPPKMMSINEFNGNPLRPMSPKSHTYAEQNVQILQKERKKYGQNREFALGGQPKSGLVCKSTTATWNGFVGNVEM